MLPYGMDSLSGIDVQIVKLQPHQVRDFQTLIAIFEDVFQTPVKSRPSVTHLQKLLANPEFFVLAAYIEQDMVGGLTGYAWDQYYSEKKLAYVYDLAVVAAHQRRGIGRLLMAEIQRICRDAGFEEVFVQADRIDAHALAFYRSTGAVEEDVAHFYYPL